MNVFKDVLWPISGKVIVKVRVRRPVKALINWIRLVAKRMDRSGQI